MVKKKIHAFDLCALLRVLYQNGYSWDDLYFVGELSNASKNSLCEKIAFSNDSVPKVTIALNMGLLSSSSPLPSFFFKMMEDDPVGKERFEKYLNFFNHHLIKDLLQSCYLERNVHLFPNWSKAMRDYFSLLGIDSLATFSLLVRLVYPDFKVEVEKNPKVIRLKESAFALGKKLASNAVLGGNATKTYVSFYVHLSIDEEFFCGNKPWPVEVRRRLEEYILPLLEHVDIHLTLLLSICNSEGQLVLNEASHLGFERLGKSGKPFELLIFYGHAKKNSKNY